MKTLWKGFFESPTHVLLPVGLSLSERCYNCSLKILHIKGTARLLLGGLLNSPCYKQSQAPLKSRLPYLCKSLDLQNPLKALCKPNYQVDCWNQGLLHADNWKYTITKNIYFFVHLCIEETLLFGLKTPGPPRLKTRVFIFYFEYLQLTNFIQKFRIFNQPTIKEEGLMFEGEQ